MNNFTVRSISAFVYLVIMVGGILIAPVFPFLVAFMIVWTMHEFYRMAYGNNRDFLLQRMLAVFTALLMFAIITFTTVGLVPGKLVASAMLPVIAIMVSPVWLKDHSKHSTISHIYTGLICIGLPISMLPMLTLKTGEHDGFLLLGILFVIWVSDVGAYVLGSLLGQRPGAWKLAPAISPKKSWWGFAGAVISGMLFAVLLHYIGIFKFSVDHCLGLGALTSGCAVLGDLVESMFKRAFGVKDSGKIMPGHGGLYDRIDSAIVAIPAAAVYLEIFGLLG